MCSCVQRVLWLSKSSQGLGSCRTLLLFKHYQGSFDNFRIQTHHTASLVLLLSRPLKQHCNEKKNSYQTFSIHTWGTKLKAWPTKKQETSSSSHSGPWNDPTKAVKIQQSANNQYTLPFKLEVRMSKVSLARFICQLSKTSLLSLCWRCTFMRTFPLAGYNLGG